MKPPRYKTETIVIRGCLIRVRKGTTDAIKRAEIETVRREWNQNTLP